MINPDAQPIGELRERIWKVIEPQYQTQLVKLSEEFGQARSEGRGSDDLVQVAEAAAASRVATLLIEADRQIAGRLDDATGWVDVASKRMPRRWRAMPRCVWKLDWSSLLSLKS